MQRCFCGDLMLSSRLCVCVHACVRVCVCMCVFIHVWVRIVLTPPQSFACMCMLFYSVVRLHSIVTLRIGVVELRLGYG